MVLTVVEGAVGGAATLAGAGNLREEGLLSVANGKVVALGSRGCTTAPSGAAAEGAGGGEGSVDLDLVEDVGGARRGGGDGDCVRDVSGIVRGVTLARCLALGGVVGA